MVMQDRGRRKAGRAFCAMRCRSWCVDALLRGPSMAAAPIAIPAATPGRRTSAHAGDRHGKPDLTLHYDRFTGKVLNSRIDISKSGEGRQMLKKWAGMAAMVGAMVAVSAPAVAGDTNNALGGALGGVA
ncbi:hypothetical protein HT748_34760, partial [Burkholderia cepacia]|nr:hypothetical protein [Burkholderia cepacia]